MRDAHDIYLIPGFFGFANLGKLTYFGHVREFLAQRCATRGLQARIHVVKTHPTASLPKRTVRIVEAIAATRSHRRDAVRVIGRAIAATRSHRRSAVHLIGHSSGGLDARLCAAPNVALPTDLDVDGLADRIRTVVTVATPHYGTPLASFFASLRGQQLLQVLSLSTIYLLRFGHLPLRALLQLGAVFARLNSLATNGTVVDQIFALLLSRFSVGRRRAVQTLFSEVARDQSLLVQLTPDVMELFNAAIRDRPGVRYASVMIRARRPGLGSTVATGVDPSGQAIHAIYGALYRLTAQTARGSIPLSPSRVVRRAYGALPTAAANDGIVPTRSQAWGTIIHAAEADHLDVIGHFNDPSHEPPHVDWLTSGSGFTRAAFEALWTDVVEFIRAAP